MKLYYNPLSPNAKRALAVAFECGANLQVHTLDFAKGENRSPDYLKLNPMGKVPTLVDDDGFTLWESPAICWYLAEKFPQAHLVPTELKARTELHRWMFWGFTHVEPALHTLAMERFIKPTLMQQPGDEHLCLAAQKELDRFLPLLNGQLEGKDWIANNKLSLADFAFAASLELAQNLKCDLTPYKHLGAWLARVQQRDSWKKASATK